MHATRAVGAAFVGAVIFAIGLAGAGCKKKGDGADAAADAAMEAAVEDAGIDTGVVEDAGVEAAAPVPTAVKTAAPATIVGLPKSCTDTKGQLGTLTFTVSGNNVTITTTSKAKAACTKKDDQFLICDWTDKDGKPSVAQRKVTYGPKRAIGGNYDQKNVFMCPPQ